MALDRNITGVRTGNTRVYRKSNHSNNNNDLVGSVIINNHLPYWLVIGILGLLLSLSYQNLVIEKETAQQNGSSSIYSLSQEESWKTLGDLNQKKINKVNSAQERVSEYLREQQDSSHGDSFSLGSTVIINGFLQDEEELRALADPHVWEKLMYAGFQWMDADDDNKENDLWKKLAKRIWEKNVLANNIVGYEYWCNILNASVPLHWHVDKDEVAFRQKDGMLRHPKMGAVFYGFPHSIRGGYLEITEADSGLLAENPNEFGGEIERIRAEYNRLVILNVSKWHGVSAVDGARYTFAVNIWNEKPVAYR